MKQKEVKWKKGVNKNPRVKRRPILVKPTIYKPERSQEFCKTCPNYALNRQMVNLLTILGFAGLAAIVYFLVLLTITFGSVLFN